MEIRRSERVVIVFSFLGAALAIVDLADRGFCVF